MVVSDECWADWTALHVRAEFRDFLVIDEVAMWVVLHGKTRDMTDSEFPQRQMWKLVPWDSKFASFVIA